MKIDKISKKYFEEYKKQELDRQELCEQHAIWIVNPEWEELT